ncbi:MAG: alpha/beta hydrolase [bacterium]|nr:alpha/beta hydrolase [bacterium]
MDYEKKILSHITSEIISGDIKIGKHLIHYIEVGEGKPIVMVHGVNIGLGQWYKNIEELSKKFKVYAIDLPGAGKSSSVDYRKLDINKDFLDIVLEFIKEKNIIRPHVIGHSVGGWIALKLAALHGNKVDKIVAVSPVGLSNYLPLSYRLISFYPFARLLSLTILKPSRKNIKKFIVGPFVNKEEIDDIFIDYFYNAIGEDPKKHPIMFINSLSGFLKIKNDFSLVSLLKNIKNDTLLIFGEHDKMVSYNRCIKQIECITNCSKEIFKNVGHVATLENCELFNKKVLNFLQK